MEKFKKGDVVWTCNRVDTLTYIRTRIERGYVHMSDGMIGQVLGYSSTGKVAVQFVHKVFDNPGQSSHDNGCHGKGRIGYCWYIPESKLTDVRPASVNKPSQRMENPCKAIPLGADLDIDWDSVFKNCPVINEVSSDYVFGLNHEAEHGITESELLNLL